MTDRKVEYVVHLRYYGGVKGKAEIYDALSAEGAVSLVMSEVPGVRVAMCAVKTGENK